MADGGGTDPTRNTQLRRVLERGRSLDVPKATLTNFLKNSVSAQV